MSGFFARLFGASDPKDDALELYRTFHSKDHRSVGPFAASLVIPSTAFLLGKSVHVLYRSHKIDPGTGDDPGHGTIDYIHEHDSVGVRTYSPRRPRARREASEIEVPDSITEATWFVLLGKCLGIAYKPGRGRDTIELENRGKLVDELYATPDGKALIVVRDKRELLYLIWGGGLDVRAEGIVG